MIHEKHCIKLNVSIEKPVTHLSDYYLYQVAPPFQIQEQNLAVLDLKKNK